MLNIVTSFNARLWDAYARNSIASWLRYLKGDYSLTVTLDGPVPEDLAKVLFDGWDPENSGTISIISLDNIPELHTFLQATSHIQTMPPNVPPHEAFRFDFRRFTPKVFSLKLMVDKAESITKAYEDADPVLWLDADIVMHKDLEVTRILKDLLHDRTADRIPPWGVVCLDRGRPWTNMESGYLLLSEEGFILVEYLWNLYKTGGIFQYREQHDSYLISRVFEMMGPEWYEHNVYSLSGRVDSNDARDMLNPMEKTWLNEYMLHLKGSRKGEIG